MNPRPGTLFEVRNLSVEHVATRGFLGRRRQRIRVLEGFDLRIHRGETLGVVGESGCGKTTLAHGLARFLRPTTGELRFEGRDVLAMDAGAMREYRRQVQLVFQNPLASLNPRLRVRSIVAEPLITHARPGRDALRARVEALLRETGLGPDHLHRFPHELSGGQAQRVALARAIALNPKLLLLDEPTSALDVSVQAQILNLLLKLKREHDLTCMIISHSLGVVQQVSDRIAVLYLGEIVEQGGRERVFGAPGHPYTRALFSATPAPDPERRRQRISLRGNVPSPANPPPGCRFHTRCPQATALCRIRKPPRYRVAEDHWVACHLADPRGPAGAAPPARPSPTREAVTGTLRSRDVAETGLEAVSKLPVGSAGPSATGRRPSPGWRCSALVWHPLKRQSGRGA